VVAGGEANVEFFVLRGEGPVLLNLRVSQLLKFGKQPVQFSLGGRYYAERPAGGPDWGLRFAVTFLFPK
jgi:hypothetical protein